jgi:hypothetical protein
LFGDSVSLSSDDGYFLGIGAPGSIECGGPGCDTTRVYQYFESTNEWNAHGQPLSGGSGFGHLVSLSPDASTLAVAALGFGDDTTYSVHLYEMQQGVWQLSFNVTGSIFGYGTWPSSYEGYISMDLSGSSPYTLAVGSSGRDFSDRPSSVSLYHN